MSVVVHRARGRNRPASTQGRPLGRKMRRAGLGVFFASIAVNAALGIYALLAPDFGETQGKILATSFCVTGAVLFALACEPAWERNMLGPVPYAGAALSALGFAVAIGTIWTEPASDSWGKALGTIFAIAFACTAASLLALARLAPRHAWVFRTTLALLALGALLVSVVFWLGDDPSEVYLRGMGVVLIVLAAFAVSIPVLHWIDRSTLILAGSTDALRFCPHCGKAAAGELGVGVRCKECGREYTVTPLGGRT